MNRIKYRMKIFILIILATIANGDNITKNSDYKIRV